MTINISIEKKDLWFFSAVLVFLAAAGLVIGLNSNNPLIHGHTADEIQGGSGGNEVLIQNSVNLTYIWCNLTITGRDYSGDSEKCSVRIHYDGKYYQWGSPEHGTYSDAACWRDLDYWLKQAGFDGYVYLGKVPGNTGDSFNCTMAKVTNYP